MRHDSLKIFLTGNAGHSLYYECAPAHLCVPPRAAAKDLKPKRVVFYCQRRSNAKFLTVTLQVLYNEMNHLSCLTSWI